MAVKSFKSQLVVVFVFLTSGQSHKRLGRANKPQVPHLRAYDFHAGGTKSGLDVPAAERQRPSASANHRRRSASAKSLAAVCPRVSGRIPEHGAICLLRCRPIPARTPNVCLPDHFSPPVTPTVFAKRASNVRDLQKASVAADFDLFCSMLI